MKLGHVFSRQTTNDSLAPPRRHVPWISSPIEKRTNKSVRGCETPEVSTISLEAGTINFEMTRRSSEDDAPRFKKHHEASSIELFYDLFFVANLATFTANHEIEDRPSLESYIGFFTLMWFTWLQTALFDVRFSNDSAYARLCKALSFGVMTGFAIVDPLFDFKQVHVEARAFRSTSIILMVSRLIFVGQYGVVMWYTRMYKQTKMPLAILMAVFFVTAMIFMGTYFTFRAAGPTHGYIGWYVTIAFEAIAVIVVSSCWRILSFKHTHLVERVGLLTLIVLGEGIIGMTKSVTKIMQGATSVFAADVGTVICAVLIIYFLWILYFDQIENDRFGTIRQQIWAILHFPLHIAILLTVEGSTQFILWWCAIENDTFSANLFQHSVDRANNGTGLYDSLQHDLHSIQNRFKGIIPFPDFSQQLSQVKNITSNSTDAEIDRGVDAINDAFNDISVWIFKNFGVVVPEKELERANTNEERLEAIFSVFFTVFLYFFISAGCTLIILAVMYWFGKTHKDRGEYLSIVVRVVVGVGLALLSTMEAAPNATVLGRFISSPWVMPTVVLAFGLVVVADNILVWYSNRHIERQISVEPDNMQEMERRET